MKTKLFITVSLLLISITSWSQRSVKNEGIKFNLNAVLIQADTFYFDLTLANHSLVGYKPAYIKFYIRDLHIVKRTAIQEREVMPLNSFPWDEVEAKTMEKISLKLPAFTVAQTKELIIEVAEKNGVRRLFIHIRGHRLLKMVRRL